MTIKGRIVAFSIDLLGGLQNTLALPCESVIKTTKTRLSSWSLLEPLCRMIFVLFTRQYY